MIEPWKENNKIKRFFGGLLYNDRYVIIGMPFFVLLILYVQSLISSKLSIINMYLVILPAFFVFIGLVISPFRGNISDKEGFSFHKAFIPFYLLGLSPIIGFITLICSFFIPWLPKNKGKRNTLSLKTQWLSNLIGSPGKKMMETYSEQELKRCTYIDYFLD